MKLNYFFIVFIISTLGFTQSSIVSKYGNASSLSSFSSEPYVSGSDGIVRMYVNIIGHVKAPGTYLVYEGIDILSLLALAGGPLPGAKLNSVRQFNKEDIIVLNLQNFLDGSENMEFVLHPHNTIYIKQSMSSYIFTNSSIISSSLQILSILLTIFNTN